MSHTFRFVLMFTLLLSCWSTPQAQTPDPGSPDPDTPRLIDALDTVFLEEMTWLEVRDALAEGKTTAIVGSGGIEQNGPWLALGKHNYILQATTEAIARKLGNALVAPIIKLVPEGDHNPPSGHMRYPGTLSLTQETFKAVVREVCTSLKVHGFENIVLIGDSGGNQQGMKEVAEELNQKYAGGGSRFHFIPEYYNFPEVTEWLETQGIKQENEGLHDDYGMEATMLVVDPNTVRMEQRIAKGLYSINGVDLNPPEKTMEMGKKLIDWRAGVAVEAIQKSMQSQ